MLGHHFPFTPTIIEKTPGDELGIALFVKRDDLFSLFGGGSKARKLQYIFYRAHTSGCNAIVTAGGAQSNHVRAAALFAAHLGWQAIMIIHAERPSDPFTGNLKLASIAGAELRFVQEEAVAGAMDQAMADLRTTGYNPFYIWGGGHSLEGAFAYYEAIQELKDQMKGQPIDFIVHASGTGTTQAGIEIGCRAFMPSCRVLGVSVARDATRGSGIILESMQALNSSLGSPVKMPQHVAFDDRWHGGGYECTYSELMDTIRWVVRTHGLLLDPTYTGKAFHALRHYVEDGTVPKGSSVVFWHTGGLLNLLSTRDI
jgi:D-cysteine desulfhydrase